MVVVQRMATTVEQMPPSRRLVPQIPFKDLAAFSGNLTTCLEAGLNVPDSLETSTRSSPCLLLRSAGPAAAERARAGAPLSEALVGLANRLPRFYLPVLHCGDQSGRVDEALRFLQQHCALLERPSRMMRNMWFVPLVVFALGSIVTVIAYFAFAPFLTAMRYFLNTAANYAVLGAVVVLILKVPQLNRIWEQLLLALPAVGPATRELAVNRFFHAFNLLYRTGGIAVGQMVRTACSAVDNTIVRDEFLATVPQLDGGATLTDSLKACSTLTADQKATVAAGEEAGKLEDALEVLCRQTSESLQFRLARFQAIFFRILALAVALSVAMTIYGLMSAYSR
jgi:type II secretory pathway component PulF